MVGISFAIEDVGAWYVPFRHKAGGNLDEAQALDYFRTNAALFNGDIVGANLSYDLDYLWSESIIFGSSTKFRDIQVADPLIYELHNSYSLQNIAQRHGLPGKDENLLKEAAHAFKVDPKGGLWELHSKYVGAYAESDVDQPLQILRRQERLIDEIGLWDIWNLETDVLPVLVRMRQRGVRIDIDKLTEIEDWALGEEAISLRKVKDATGYDIGIGNVWKATALAQPLKHLGLDIPLTPKTGAPSIDSDFLKSIDHAVGKELLHARKVNKIRTTFGKSIRNYMVGDRIHCTFNQIARQTESGDQRGARFGRLSATDPNMQQQPNPEKDPVTAGEWRKIYIPEEGAMWGCLDYSQQEPRWATHYAAKANLAKAGAAATAYHEDPNLDNHSFMAEITGLPRAHAKLVYLGVLYGEGGAKLCRDLGLETRWTHGYKKMREWKQDYFPTRDEAFSSRDTMGDGRVWEVAGVEGQEILDKFDQRAPFLRRLAQIASGRAKSRGWVKTYGGRKLHFPRKKDGSFDWSHKALNRIIQGSSADQMKRALVIMHEEMPDVFISLQVHDEVDGSFESIEQAKRVAEIMSESYEALVPFKVDVEVGKSWGEIAKV